MEPKEKAVELVNKYKLGDVVTEKLQTANINPYAKLFALIAVDEIILEREVIYASIGISPGTFWHQVKEEIEKL